MPNGLKIDELIEDEYYQCYEKDVVEIVFQYKGNTGDPDRPKAHHFVARPHGYETTNNAYVKDTTNESCTPWITERNCRPATPLEIHWLTRCKQEDKYVEKPGKLLSQDELLKTAELIRKMTQYPEGLEETKDMKFKIPEEYKIEKTDKEFIYSDFYHGQRFEANIRGVYTCGKITIGTTAHDEKIFLCQDEADGNHCDVKHGYKHSYEVGTNEKELKSLNIAGSAYEITDLILEKSIMDIVDPPSNVSISFVADHWDDQVAIQLELKRKALQLLENGSFGSVGLPGAQGTPGKKNLASHYINVIKLDDPADDKIMSEFTSALAFEGFSRLNGGAIFKVKEFDDEYSKFIDTVIELGGEVELVELGDHIQQPEINYTNFPIKW